MTAVEQISHAGLPTPARKSDPAGLIDAGAPSDHAIRSLRFAGLAIVLGLVGVVGGWSHFTEISGAVIANGSVVVDGEVKKVQHQAGGIVGEIRAQNGWHVKAGDLLVRLDETMTRANLEIARRNLAELWARKSRLVAERDGLSAIQFPSDLEAVAMTDNMAGEVKASEQKVFDLRAQARTGQKSLLAERQAQVEQEIAGHQAQIASKSNELEFLDRELKGVRSLFKKKLIGIERMSELERSAERLRGELASLTTAIAQSKGKVGEVRLQIVQIDRDMMSEVSTELRDVEAKIGELIERRIAADDQMRRIDIRAPIDGVVHQSIVHTIGGVISAGEVLMVIVPEHDQLTVETKISPRDIDQLWIGQPAHMRFSAFNQRTTPEIAGKVDRISADVSTDEKTGQSYYTVRVALERDEVKRLGDVKVVPGMPVEAMITTDNRTVLSYLTKPLRDQIAKSFRD